MQGEVVRGVGRHVAAPPSSAPSDGAAGANKAAAKALQSAQDTQKQAVQATAALQQTQQSIIAKGKAMRRRGKESLLLLASSLEKGKGVRTKTKIDLCRTTFFHNLTKK